MLRKMAVAISIMTAIFSGCATAPTPTPFFSAPPMATLNFTLAVNKAQSIDDGVYTIPIYLTRNQVLHFNWQLNEGNTLWISATTPSGKIIGARDDGGFNNDFGCQRLSPIGSLTLSPTAEWGEGYYYLHPHITEGKVSVQVKFWIDSK